MRIKRLKLIITFIFLIAACAAPAEKAFAESGEESFNASLDEQLNTLDFEGLQSVISGSVGAESGFSFRETVTRAINGELNLSPSAVIGAFVSMLAGEARENAALMRNLIIIGILSAVLKILTDSFDSNAVGELGFYVCYAVLVMVLLAAFGTGVGVARSLMETLAALMRAGIPIIVTLLVMSGAAYAPLTFSPVLYAMTNVTVAFISGVLAPFLILAASMEIVNYLTEKEILSNLAGLVKSVCVWSLKGVAFVFVTVLSLQKLTAPILNNLAVKSAKAAAGMVPVVGDMLGGAADIVLAWSQAMKSGVLAAAVVAIIMICALPVIKLLALIFIFKLTAAVIQPVCDERIVKCTNAAGSFSMVLLGLCVTVIVMFVVSLIILLSF